MRYRSGEDREIVVEKSPLCGEKGVRLNDDFQGFFLNQDRGVYVLCIKLTEERTITIGKLSDIHFSRGYYAYVGSAMNGLKSRLSRHLRRDKKLHWHIDHLLEKASIVDISVVRTEERVECTVAQALGSQFDSVLSFGSSDCRCHSHLFFAAEGKRMQKAIMTALELLTIPPKLMRLT